MKVKKYTIRSKKNRGRKWRGVLWFLLCACAGCIIGTTTVSKAETTWTMGYAPTLQIARLSNSNWYRLWAPEHIDQAPYHEVWSHFVGQHENTINHGWLYKGTTMDIHIPWGNQYLNIYTNYHASTNLHIPNITFQDSVLHDTLEWRSSTYNSFPHHWQYRFHRGGGVLWHHNIDRGPLYNLPLETFVTISEAHIRNFAYHSPIVTHNQNTWFSLGSPADWTRDIAGRSTGPNNFILNGANGGVSFLSYTGGSVQQHVSSNGVTFDRLGHANIIYRLRDPHSRDTSNPDYAGDNTYVDVQRAILVNTTQTPAFTFRYAAGAVANSGAAIGGTGYHPTTASLPCGGEEGWTSKPLQLIATPGSLQGHFTTLLRAPSVSDALMNNGNATINSYHVQSPNASGTQISSYLAYVPNTAQPLSGTGYSTVKIDRTAPVANATHNGNWHFTNASSDALSGLSPTRPAQISFVSPPTSTNTPPTTGWGNLNTNTPTAPGQYDVWIQATDKAGNITQRKVFAALTRTTTQTPTLTVTYATGAVSTTGASIAGQNFPLNTGTRACGGENGWTRHPLVLRISRGAIPQGHFSNILSAPSISDIVANNADAVHNTYHVQSANASGSTVAGWLTQVGNTSNVLSGTVYGNVKIDRTAPIANATHNGNWHFTNASSDALSGLSPTRPAQISFVSPPTSTNTPPTTGWANLNTNTPAGIGAYDVWIRATDQAGNVTERKVFAALTRTTTENPAMVFGYSPGAVSPTGTSITGNTYYHTYPFMLCGGEDGWTNQPLQLISNPGSWLGQGHYTNILRAPSIADVMADNGFAFVTTYHVESPNASGSTVAGWFTQVGNTSNVLSATGYGTVKIDRTAPIANATHDGGFHFTDASSDALSGLSASRSTQISFVTPPTASTTPPTTGWANLNTSTPTNAGEYDVWIRATDKAGNTATTKVFAGLSIIGEVELTKSADVDFTSHVDGCPNVDSLTVELGCDTDCSEPTDAIIAERSTLNYKIQLKNTATIGSASGTFEDYLPKGVVVTATPTAIPSSGITLTYALETSGAYTGHYKVSGSYTAIAAGAQIEINIPCTTPNFDIVTATNNILNNQATSTWTIGPPAAPIGPRTSTSNHVLHEVISVAVPVVFTKVSADSLSTGLSGVHFALYRWGETTSPTQIQREHMIDTSLLIDTIAGGNWVRVRYDGETATAISDGFVSAISPLGEVNLGRLDDGLYTLVETKTAPGYALPVGQWLITVDSDKTDVGVDDYKIEFAGKTTTIMPPAAIRESVGIVHTYKIINARPFTVGMSGLGGTKGILLIGFAIMAISGNAYILYSYKQKNKQKNKRQGK